MTNQIKYLLLIFGIFNFTNVYSQYSLTILKNQTYTEITNPIYTVYDDEPEWNNILIKPDLIFKGFGQNYNFNNGVYTVLPQGYIYFINSTHSTTIYAAEGIYEARKGLNQQSSFSFKVDTVLNQKILKLQWKNIGFQNGDSSHFSNFQLFLNTSTGKIQINYGPNNTIPGLYVDNLNGPAIGILEMDESFSAIKNILFLEGDASSAALNKQGQFINLNNTPANGTSYEFSNTYDVGIDNKDQSYLLEPYFNQNELKFKSNTLENNNYKVIISSVLGQTIAELTANKDSSIHLDSQLSVYFVTIISGLNSKTYKVIKTIE